MIRVRLILVGLLAALALTAGAAAASPLDVWADYADNGVIDRAHSTEDLLAALSAARGDAAYASLAEAVDDALEHALLGRTDQGRPAAPPVEDTTFGILPSPRHADESGNPPWPLLALATLAGLLAISGAGSSIYRRLQRAR